MDESRRRFLKVAGAAVFGYGWTLGAGRVLGQHGHGQAVSAPEGTRWAMVIDTAKCMREQGCTACIDSCHRVHNVPRIDDAELEIRWIWKEPYDRAFPTQVHPYTEDSLLRRQVLVLCNHCKRPPCVRVCPTQATFKRDDGIIAMDQHRCIGCRYCVAACPYGSRSFNWEDPRPHIEAMHDEFPTRMRGVVEKCNFCSERLAVGRQPACVEACRRQGEAALVFGDLNDPESEVAHLLRGRHSIRRKPGLGTEPHVFYLV